MTTLQNALDRLWSADDDANIVEFDGDWHQWREVRDLAECIDAALDAAGSGPGSRVAVVLGNRVESVAALLALLRAGRTLVTLSPLQPPERLSADLRASAARFVLAPADLWQHADFVTAVEESQASAWSVDGAEMQLRHIGRPVSAPGNPDVLIEMLTSGTTGAPKRIPLTRSQVEASLGAALRHNDRSPASEKPALTGSVALVTLPIVHIGGLWTLLQALTAARPFVLLPRFSVDGWHQAVRQYRPKLVGLPPPAIRSVLDADIPREDLASIRAINAGTSPVDPALVDEFYERYGIPILIVYGATEFTGAVAGWTLRDFRARWHDKRGSVGRAFPGVGLRVVDNDGDEVPAGTPGRLHVASAQAGASGDWVATSDLAHLDADGFLYIDGRADDVIIRGGFKIAPETVVKALRTHPAVIDAAVAGLPDARLGHVPVAAVQLTSEAAVGAADLERHCRASLTPYEIPTEIFVVDELPRSAALKVDRRSLIELLERRRALAAADRITENGT
ncbi:long-chain fatty acid--CoA ligase [Mycobacterium eburneum]|nr:fatty acid--CoA ligase family protein [Mycobacterium eburneum]TDH48358.1 long-chain fatty acid--CoA ligase [Mycobacterium eburneum]